MNESFFGIPEAWLRKAWEDGVREYIKYDVLPAQKKKEWDNILSSFEGDTINLNKFQLGVYATFEKSDVEKITSIVMKRIKEREKEEKKRNKEELKERKRKLIQQQKEDEEKSVKNLPHLSQAKETISNFDNYMQLANRFFDIQPYFYTDTGIWWLWDGNDFCWKIVDEIDIMNEIDDALKRPNTTQSKIKGEILESMKRVGRRRKPKEAPVRWIQFKNKVFSLRSHKIHDITHHYFFTNPVPWEMGTSEDTPIIDKLFKEWVGEKYMQDLYEILAYACYRAYPIQTLICLYGYGRNGKSQYLKLLQRFLGITNICSTELDLIAGINSSRFEIFKLYKKLVCIMGETNFGLLNGTSLLKKLTGGDLIGFEKKGKDGFDDYSYAKIVIASNSLPSSDDTSEGYARRWHIIDFPNEFPEGKDIIDQIPSQEYNNLALKICNIIPKLIEKGKFANQGSIKDRKEKYMMASNPLPLFLKEYTIVDPLGYVSYNELYTRYIGYLIQHKKRRVKNKEFKAVLEEEGFWADRTSKKVNDEFINGYWIQGLVFKEDYVNCVKNTEITTHPPTHVNQLGIFVHSTQNTQKDSLTVEEEMILDAEPIKPQDSDNKSIKYK